MLLSSNELGDSMKLNCILFGFSLDNGGGSRAISHWTHEFGFGRPISIKIRAMWVNLGRFSGRCWSICCRRRPRQMRTSKKQCISKGIFKNRRWHQGESCVENRVWKNVYSLAKFATSASNCAHVHFLLVTPPWGGGIVHLYTPYMIVVLV